MSADRVTAAIVRVLPVVPPLAFFVAAAVRDVGFGGVLAMLFCSALSFLAVLAVVILQGLRRRAQGAAEAVAGGAGPVRVAGPTPLDLAWVGGLVVLWVVAAFVPPLATLGLVIAGVLVTGLAIRREAQALRGAVGGRPGGRSPWGGGRGPGGQGGPGGPASGPDAGKVIIMNPSNPDPADGPPATGGMPGSTRIDPDDVSDSTRPGSNFGANRAPVSPTWDPTRPVPGGEPPTGATGGAARSDDVAAEGFDDAERPLGYDGLADVESDGANDGGSPSGDGRPDDGADPFGGYRAGS